MRYVGNTLLLVKEKGTDLVQKSLNSFIKTIRLLLILFKIKKLHFLDNEIVKACVRYFLINFYFSPKNSPSKTTKDVFLFHLKALFVLEIFNVFYVHLPLSFSLSAIALGRGPR